MRYDASSQEYMARISGRPYRRVLHAWKIHVDYPSNVCDPRRDLLQDGKELLGGFLLHLSTHYAVHVIPITTRC